MADLLFILFGFSCFAFVGLVTALHVWSYPNQSNTRSTSCSVILPHLVSVL